jgi:hypothetical protein
MEEITPEKLSKVIARTNKRKNKELLSGHIFNDLIGPRLLRWIDENTTGEFNVRAGKVIFKDSKDATMYALRFK